MDSTLESYWCGFSSVVVIRHLEVSLGKVRQEMRQWHLARKGMIDVPHCP